MDNPSADEILDDDSSSSSSSNVSMFSNPGVHDIDINGYEDPSTITPLMRAARNGNIEAVRSALTSGYHVNTANNQGFTALHYAVIAEFSEIVNLLLELIEINTNATDWNGTTALMHACKKRVHIDIIESLLKHDCDVELKDNRNMTALWYALVDDDGDFTGFNPAIIVLLTDYGADIHAPGMIGCNTSPVNYVLTSFKSTAAVRAEVTAALLYCGADPSRSLDVFDKISDKNLYEMVLPYFSTCDINAIVDCSIFIISDLWKIQGHYNKQKFAELVRKSDIKLVKILHFSTIRYFSDRETQLNNFEKLTSFLYELYDTEEMYNVLYTGEMGKEIQLHIICHLYRLKPIPDKTLADLLRLSLCNFKYMYPEIYRNLFTIVKFPRDTIKVLEDFNVPFILRNYSEIIPEFRSELMGEPFPEIFWSWSMYLSPSSEIRTATSNFTTNSLFRKFYRNCKDTNPPSLLELSRNVIRDCCRDDIDLKSKKPFMYAARIKSLTCSKLIQDILLLRKPIYN